MHITNNYTFVLNYDIADQMNIDTFLNGILNEKQTNACFDGFYAKVSHDEPKCSFTLINSLSDWNTRQKICSAFTKMKAKPKILILTRTNADLCLNKVELCSDPRQSNLWYLHIKVGIPEREACQLLAEVVNHLRQVAFDNTGHSSTYLLSMFNQTLPPSLKDPLASVQWVERVISDIKDWIPQSPKRTSKPKLVCPNTPTKAIKKRPPRPMNPVARNLSHEYEFESIVEA
jgi:hypothetical protein